LPFFLAVVVLSRPVDPSQALMEFQYIEIEAPDETESFGPLSIITWPFSALIAVVSVSDAYV